MSGSSKKEEIQQNIDLGREKRTGTTRLDFDDTQVSTGSWITR